jgi:hypothetical protein
VKSFEAEARAAFAFLTDQGFTVGAELPTDVGRRPSRLMVRFQGAGATVETSLVLGFAGEDGVQTTVFTTTGISELGATVAHKSHEMRKALHAHADEVRVVLASR